MAKINKWLSDHPSNRFPYDPHSPANLRSMQSWLRQAPVFLFSAPLSTLQREAINLWYDTCLSCYHLLKAEPEISVQWLELAYSHLQGLAADANIELDCKEWCFNRLDNLIVAIIECHHQQEDDISAIVDAHIAFMVANHNQNLRTIPKTSS